MGSILDQRESRVKLLKAGFTGSDIEYLAVSVFDSNVELTRVNWRDPLLD